MGALDQWDGQTGFMGQMRDIIEHIRENLKKSHENGVDQEAGGTQSEHKVDYALYIVG